MKTKEEVIAYFKESVELFKEIENDYASLAILRDNTPAIKVLSLWTKVPVWYDYNLENAFPTDIFERWNWLWSNVIVDISTLSRATGYSEQLVDYTFDQLKIARLVLPDNTYPSKVEAHMTIFMKSMLSFSTKGGLYDS